MEDRKCSVCGEIKPISAFFKKGKNSRGLQAYSTDCRGCRSLAYYRRKGVEISTTCKRCDRKSLIASNGLCHACLRKAGRKECRRCKLVKLAAMDFYGKRGECIDCSSRAEK